MPSNQPKSFYYSATLSNILVAGLLLLFLCNGVVAFWGAERGFDLTDEGAYYLEALYPAENRHHHTSYHLINRAIFRLLKYDIIAVRRTAYLFTFASAFMFCFGLISFLRSQKIEIGRHDVLILGLLVAIGSLLGFSWTPPAFSYNTLNAMLLMTASGLAFFAASEERMLAACSWATGSYLCLVVDWFIKPSTCLVLLVLLTGFMIVSSRLTWRKMAVIGVNAVILAALPLVIAILIGDPHPWMERLSIINLATQKGVGGELIGKAFRDFAHLWLSMIIDHGWVLAAFLGGAAWLRWNRNYQNKMRVLAVGVLILGIVAVHTFLGGYLESGYRSFAGPFRFLLTFYLAILVGVGIAYLLMRKVIVERVHGTWASNPRPIIVLIALLFLLPLAGSFGSGNPLSFNALFQMGPWFALIWFFTRELSTIPGAPAVCMAGSLMIGIAATCQYVNGYVFHPYNLPTDLFAQSESTRIGIHDSRLLLDHRSKKFIKKIRRALEKEGFRDGDDIFAFYGLPGLVYAIGGCSPGHSWFFGPYRDGINLDATLIRSLDPDRVRKAFIIQQGNVHDFVAVFKSLGIRFPEDYILCSKRTSPFTGLPVRIWKPNFGKSNLERMTDSPFQ